MDTMKILAKTLDILLGEKPDAIEKGYNSLYSEKNTLNELNLKLVETEDGGAEKIVIDKELQIAIDTYNKAVEKIIDELEEKLLASEKKFNDTFDKLRKLLKGLGE